MKWNRPAKILTGLVVGTLIGLLCHFLAPDSPSVELFIVNVAQPAGQLFLRLIFMIVVPLVFSSLVLGIVELGDFRSVGRVGAKTLAYTIVASITSVVIGLGLVTFFKPGVGLDPAIAQRFLGDKSKSAKVIEQAAAAKSIPDALLSLIPKNPLHSAVQALEGEMVSMMVFALIFGAALVLVRGDKRADPLFGVLETIRDASLKVVDFAMAVAPIGVAGLMFAMTARFGWGMLLVLGKYVLVVILGLLIQQFVVYGALLRWVGKRSPWQFFIGCREVIITAFSTASSNATLPTSIRVAENELGIDRRIANFVLTIGSTANQNGTALFEGVTILFLAQVFGVELTVGQQITVLFMSVVAGIGTAGVPGGSIPLIVIVLQSVGVPAEGIGIILGVDRLLDMSRTVLNVTGDLVAAALVDASEKAAHGRRSKKLIPVRA